MKDFKIYYGLEFNPFEKGQPDIPVDTSDYREAMGRLDYLKGVRGIGLFTGRSGTGKSFIMKKFSETLNPGLYKVIYMPMSTLSTIEFYQIHTIKTPFSTYCKSRYLLCLFDIFYSAFPSHIFIAAFIYQFFFIRFHLLPPLPYHYRSSSCLLLLQLSNSVSSDCLVFLMNPDRHLIAPSMLPA